MLNLLRMFVSYCPPLMGPGDEEEPLPEYNARLLNDLRESGTTEEEPQPVTL